MELAEVARAVRRAVPGARVTETGTGITETTRHGNDLVGREPRPEGGPWAVLVEPSTRRPGVHSEEAEEPLQPVLEAITAAPGWAGLQVVITCGARRRADPLGLFDARGVGAGIGRRLGRTPLGLAKLIAAILLELLKSAALDEIHFRLAMPMAALAPARERGRGFYATVDELAALGHLSAKPSRYYQLPP